CEEVPHITYCNVNDQCGECLGQCQDVNNICYVNKDILESSTGTLNFSPKFICGSPSKEPKFNQSNMISFADNPPQTTGTVATWIAVISVIIIVALLTWGITKHFS